MRYDAFVLERSYGVSDYEKVLYVRLPTSQHAEITDLARKDDRSITSAVRVLLAEAVEARRKAQDRARQNDQTAAPLAH
jgi:hypothetical protein